MIDFRSFLERFVAFSRTAFGPYYNEERILSHLQKEIEEIRSAETIGERHKEWVDIVILGLDGLSKSILDDNMYNKETNVVVNLMLNEIYRKQNKNEVREWPDWRSVPSDKPIEHLK